MLQHKCLKVNTNVVKNNISILGDNNVYRKIIIS